MNKIKEMVTNSAKSFWKDPIGSGLNAGLQVLGFSFGLYIILCCANCGAQIVISSIK